MRRIGVHAQGLPRQRDRLTAFNGHLAALQPLLNALHSNRHLIDHRARLAARHQLSVGGVAAIGKQFLPNADPRCPSERRKCPTCQRKDTDRGLHQLDPSKKDFSQLGGLLDRMIQGAVQLDITHQHADLRCDTSKAFELITQQRVERRNRR